MSTKKLIPVEYGIQFSQEEIEKLGWKDGQKLFVETFDDGSVSISKGEEVEIDISDFTKQELVGIIEQMHKEDLTFNEFVEKVLKEFIEFNGAEMDSTC